VRVRLSLMLVVGERMKGEMPISDCRMPIDDFRRRTWVDGSLNSECREAAKSKSTDVRTFNIVHKVRHLDERSK